MFAFVARQLNLWINKTKSVERNKVLKGHSSVLKEGGVCSSTDHIMGNNLLFVLHIPTNALETFAPLLN